MDYKKLLSEGYYIRTERGEYKNRKINNCYSIVKDTNNESRSIACLINLAAKNILIKKIGFKEVVSEKTTCWLNYPDHLDFSNQTEPLKITWHK